MESTEAVQHRHALELELIRLGEERAEALRQAEESLVRIVAVAHDAVAAGIAVAEVWRLSGVSRQTLHTRMKASA